MIDRDSIVRELESILGEAKAAENKPNRELHDKPYIWGSLYALPNPDGSRKNCKNCAFWVTTQNCVIHERSLTVSSDAVCGYHTFGRPRAEWVQLEGVQPYTPDLSGLEKVEGGSSCDLCAFYSGDENSGTCGGLIKDDGSELKVKAKSCCARWESKNG